MRTRGFGRQMLWIACWFGCGDKNDESTDTNDGVEDTAVTEDTSINQYKIVYCEEYAMRCDVYATVEECVAEFDTWFSEDCIISDKETFDVCADWLFSLDCNTEGWIFECETFYTCPN